MKRVWKVPMRVGTEIAEYEVTASSAEDAEAEARTKACTDNPNAAVLIVGKITMKA